MTLVTGSGAQVTFRSRTSERVAAAVAATCAAAVVEAEAATSRNKEEQWHPTDIDPWCPWTWHDFRDGAASPP